MSGSNDEKIKCIKCKKEKAQNYFYNNNNPLFSSEKLELCKVCIITFIGDKDSHDYEKRVLLVLAMMNKPLYFDKFENSSHEWGKYITKISSLVQFNDKDFSDSDYFNEREEASTTPNQPNIKITKELYEKWGDYPADEIILFEKKYQQLKINYPERTALHIEALVIYVRYRVKEELATQKGSVKEAKEWGALAQKAAQDAKINPSQLSKADLSDGLDSFSQLTRNVEQAIDVIEILPQFKARPQDSVDFTIWCYVNYVRDLKGLPPAKYEEVYSFYEQRKKDYEKNQEDDEDGIL